MTKGKEEKTFDISKVENVETIPKRKSKTGIDWKPLLQKVIDSKHGFLRISEDDAKLATVRNGVNTEAKRQNIKNIALNVRKENGKEYLYISVKKK